LLENELETLKKASIYSEQGEDIILGRRIISNCLKQFYKQTGDIEKSNKAKESEDEALKLYKKIIIH